MKDISRVAELSVISDADAAGLVTSSTRADLGERITSLSPGAPVSAPPTRPGLVPRLRGPASRRRWLIGVPAAVCLAVAVLVITSLGSRGERIGPVTIGPVRAEALVFTRHGHYINVIVRNPLADPRKYRAEFRAHGLDISLKLIPVSPSIVGTVVYFDGTSAIKVISARGKCFTGGGGPICPVGLRVPVDYRGRASMVFGRAARPGERYESTVSATAPGEALHGMRLQGRHVSAVLAMIAGRGVTAAEFHVTTAKGTGELWPASKVPGNWWVYGADPWAPGQVMLWVGKTRHQPAPGPGNPVATPAPTPSPS
jgi:hypothetical protein